MACVGKIVRKLQNNNDNQSKAWDITMIVNQFKNYLF